MGKTLIVANWKMHLTIGESSLFIHKLADMVDQPKGVEVVIAPTSIALQPISLQAHKHHFKLAAQNFYWRDEGAFTGEVSAHQLRGLTQYALVGHSERRHIFGETNKDVRSKVQAAIRHGIKPILCVGETAMERHDGETGDVIHDQVSAGLANLTSEDMKHVVVAYEPVWAISDGKNFNDHAVPTPESAASEAKLVRRQIEHMFGKKIAEQTPVLYGASVNPDNARGFLDAEGIDGLLVGGASLNAHTFADIIKQAEEKPAKKGKKK